MNQNFEEKYGGEFFSGPWLPLEEIHKLVDDFMSNDKGKEELVGKYVTPEQQRNYYITHIIRGFEDYFWKTELDVNNKNNKPLTHLELKELYLKKIYKLTRADYPDVNGKEEERKYRSTDWLFGSYYHQIELKIIDDLYYKYKGCYTIEELEKVIPHLDSPYYYRDRIKLRYMRQMQNLKNRGEEWKEMIKKLEEMFTDTF